MGKELPMARQETSGWSMLLARTGSREYIFTTPSRNERKEEVNTSKGNSYSPPISAAQASKTSSKAKATSDGAYKTKGHRRDSKDRKPAGGDEGRDSSTRRSAQELGIELPEDRCWESPSHAHWFTPSVEIAKGHIWICKYCLRAKWLPGYWSELDRFSSAIAKYGLEEAYWKWLDRRPTIAPLLRKLEDLRLMKKVISEDDYIAVVAAVMGDKEYPYEEVK